MALKKYLCVFFCSFATRQNTNNKMKNTVYSFKMLSLLIVLAFSNYSMAQEVSLKKQDVKTKEKIKKNYDVIIPGHSDIIDKNNLCNSPLQFRIF